MLTLLLAAAFAQPPCGFRVANTPDDVARAVDRARRAGPPVLRAAGASPREGFAGWPHVVTSEHFALWWGEDDPPDAVAIEAMLAAAEEAWDHHHGVLGHRLPADSDRFLFNLYVGGTAPIEPAPIGAAGYATVDPDGYPFFVIERPSLEDLESTRQTILHEYYHTIQLTIGRYEYYGVAAWYWEATAEWATAQALPDELDPWGFVFAYLTTADLPMSAFEYPLDVAEGDPMPYRQYGAWLWPEHLTRASDVGLVVESWENEPTGEAVYDPQEALRAGLTRRGLDMDALYLEHAIQLATDEVPGMARWKGLLDLWLDYLQDDYPRMAGWIPREGRSSLRSRPGVGRYGSEVWRWFSSLPGRWEVELVPGELPAGAALHAAIVVVGEETRRIDLVEQADGSFTAGFEMVMYDDVMLVVAGGSGLLSFDWTDERFPYRLSALPLPDPPVVEVEPAEERGCGCDGGARSTGTFAALMAWALRRRRR